MDQHRTSAVPNSRGPLFIAIVLLLLPLVYLGSYCLLAVPRAVQHERPWGIGVMIEVSQYRIPGEFPRCIFWPLEQLDRRLRSREWEIGDGAQANFFGQGPRYSPLDVPEQN